MKNFLIIKPSSFGDIVHALPSVVALKKAFPDCRITWVVFPAWKGIVELCPDIDEIIVWDRKQIVKSSIEIVKKYRKTGFDYIIDLQGLLRSALLAKFLKGRVKIGVSGMKEFSGLLLKEIKPENAKINATLRNLQTIEFITNTPQKPQIHLILTEKILKESDDILKRNDIGGDFIALLPFARGKGKNWGAQNYLELIPLLKEKYPKTSIIILGGKKDFGQIKTPLAIDLCAQTDLKQLAAILSKSKFAIGADTGPMHLAAVLNIPCIFIWGVSDIIETSPYLGRWTIISDKSGRQNIQAIRPKDIINAIHNL